MSFAGAPVDETRVCRELIERLAGPQALQAALEGGNQADLAARLRATLTALIQPGDLLIFDNYESVLTPDFQPALRQELLRRGDPGAPMPAGYAAYGAWLARRASGEPGRSPALAKLVSRSMPALEAATGALAGDARLWHLWRLANFRQHFGTLDRAREELEGALDDAAPKTAARGALLHELANIICGAEQLAAMPVATEVPPPDHWVWPTRGRLTSGSGPRWGGFHNGIDIANRAGTPTVAARAGRVLEAGWCRSYGYCVRLGHAGGIETIYGHLLTRPVVAVGAEVAAGQVIGHMGSTYDRRGGGYATGVHLHLSVLVNGRAVNPLRFLPCVGMKHRRSRCFIGRGAREQV